MDVTGTAAVTQDGQAANATGLLIATNGGFLTPTTPNLADFWAFLLYNVDISQAALPLSSPWPQYTLTWALGLVLNIPMVSYNCATMLPAIAYTLAVYNCATHLLMTIAPDQPGQNFFTNKRAAGPLGYGLIVPSTGIVVASADVSTSSTLAKPTWAEGLTVGQLQMMKTPWGREYLSFIQSFGPTVWGIS